MAGVPSSTCGGPAPPRLVLTDHLVVRALAAAEAPLLQAHVAGLSARSRQSRFLGGVNLLTRAEAERLVGGAGGLVFALAAEADAGGGRELIGEGVCAIGTDGVSAEFALSVADAWQGQGVGRAILAGLALRAIARGAGRLHGEVLRGNDRMLSLAARAGFVAAAHRGDPRLLRVERVFPAAAVLRARLRAIGTDRALAA